MPDAPPLPPALEPLFQKLRKGMAAGLTPKVLPQVLALFPGWTIETRPVYAAASDTYALEPLAGVRLLTDSGQGDPAGPRHVAWHYSREEAEAEREALAPHVVDAFPDPAQKASPVYVLRHLSEVVDAPLVQTVSGPGDETPRPQFRFELYAKTKVTRVTAPDGQTYDICTDRVVGFRSTRNYQQFFAWAAEHTGLLADLNRILGTEPYVKPEDRVRTDENVGTCGICDGRFKVTPEREDRLVNHGFKRPGWGFLTDGCFGVGYPPYELSPTACEDAIVRWEQYRDQLERELARHAAGEITAFTDHRGRYGKAGAAYAQGTREFDRLLPQERRRLEGELRDVKQDLLVLRTKVAEWAPHPERIWRPGQPKPEPPRALGRRR